MPSDRCALFDTQRGAHLVGSDDPGTHALDDPDGALDELRVGRQHAPLQPNVVLEPDPDIAAGEHSGTITWQQLADYEPEVIVLMPCGFDLMQTRRELPAMTAHAEWQTLPAVTNHRVYSVDGSAYFNRPGPRIVESAEIFAALLQPGRFARLAPPNSWEQVGE